MIENKIKEIIIEQYGSVKNFSNKINVPYTTVDTILKRGLFKSNVLNVIKICNELNIDINELTNNRVVFKWFTKIHTRLKMVGATISK